MQREMRGRPSPFCLLLERDGDVVPIRRGSVDAGAFTARRRQALGYIRVSLKLAPRRSDYEAGFGLVAYRYVG